VHGELCLAGAPGRKPNRVLEKYFPRLVPGAGETVFVPLCGKTEDLAWLASRGHRVVGVEWVESAVRAFFEERGLTPSVTQDKGLTRYEAQGVVVFAGDFFSVTPAHLGGATVLYDRAAMIALPAPMRERYVKQLRALMPVGRRGAAVPRPSWAPRCPRRPSVLGAGRSYASGLQKVAAGLTDNFTPWPNLERFSIDGCSRA